MKGILSLSIILFFCLNAIAFNEIRFESDGIFYEIITGTKKVKVTYDSAKLTRNEFGEKIGNTYTGIVNVPSKVMYNDEEYTVTEVGEYAFGGGPGLVAVNLPETIEIIGKYAFYDNDGLTEMILPSSVKSIGVYGFRNCYNLESINFPEGLEYIGGDAFTHDRKLTELILPSSLKQIDYYAFCACTGVKRVVLKDSDEPLKKNPLYGGGQTIFDQLDVDYAYLGRSCETDDGVNRPIRIKTKELVIGGSTFKYLPAEMFYPEVLEKLTIPASVTSVTANFIDFTKLREIILEDGDQNLFIPKSDDFGMAGNAGLMYCPLEKAYVGRLLETSWNSAMPFSYSSTLKELVIGASQTIIPDYAYLRCSALESVSMPSTIEKLGNGCFSDCVSLPEITIPEKVSEIPYRAFDHCESLQRISFAGENVKSIGELAFCGAVLEELNLPASVAEIGKNAFSYNFGLKKIELTEGLQIIDRNAFASCKNVTEVYIPASVTQIRQSAFSYLSSLKRIKFEDSDIAIGTEYASGGYYPSITYALPFFNESTDSIEYIYMGREFVRDKMEFVSGCTQQIYYSYMNIWGEDSWRIKSVPTVVFGTKLYSTSNEMFKKFPGIKKVICEGKLNIPYYSMNTFRKTSEIPLYVPKGYVSTYQNDYYWRDFKSIQENIKPYALYLDSRDMTMYVGDKISLTPYFYPSDAVNTDLKWWSEDEEIVRISGDGEFTAIGAGSAKVSVSFVDYPEIKTDCNVIVLPIYSALETVSVEDKIATQVCVDNGVIRIYNLSGGEDIRVLNTHGYTLFHTDHHKSTGGIVTYMPESKGVYIVMVDGISIKLEL